MTQKPTFGQNIRDARRRRGLRVAEVAERAGVRVASVYLCESDGGMPRDKNLSALCKVLKLPVRATREMVAG
jgi:transcriptional regulator with XRE-family HTH domain